MTKPAWIHYGSAMNSERDLKFRTMGEIAAIPGSSTVAWAKKLKKVLDNASIRADEASD